MSDSFKKKSSSFFVTAFIGLIIVSFMFTGYESMKGTPDTVATVGDKTVLFREYQNEYNRQVEFYQRFTGGSTLTTQQIQQFGIRDNAVSSLVSGKLMITLAEKLGVQPSSYQVKEEIKQLPYFQTNGKFDLERYKLLLSSNGLTPADFESDIKDQIKSQSGQVFFARFPISNKYLEDIQQFKAERMKGHLVKINREATRKYLPVSNAQIQEFLAVEANARRVEVMFNEQKANLDQANEVKARHILVNLENRSEEEALKKVQEIKKELTTRNFIRLANQHTDDPSGKENGGDLGWFAANGMMVPEFEQAAFALNKGSISDPVKTDFGYHLIYVEDKKEAKEALFEEHRDRMAKELVQRNMVDELDAFVLDLKNQATQALAKKDIKAITRLQDEYGIQYEKDLMINRFDGATGQITLTTDQVTQIFNEENADKLQTFEDANAITLAEFASVPPATAEELAASLEQNRTQTQTTLARIVQEGMIERLREDVKVRVNTSLLR